MLCYLRFAHARYGSQMIDRFLYWGDHRNQKRGAIKGSCHCLSRPNSPTSSVSHGFDSFSFFIAYCLSRPSSSSFPATYILVPFSQLTVCVVPVASPFFRPVFLVCKLTRHNSLFPLCSLLMSRPILLIISSHSRSPLGFYLIKVIPLKLFYYQTLFETWRN